MPHSESISLSDLQAMIKAGIDRAHPLPYWVTAEISELKVNYSGHCYLELVEKGGANHVPKAKANAVIWRSTYAMLEPYFRQMTGQTLAAGLQVLVKVVVSYHELYGLSLQITDIDPAYTLGDMERQRQETIARLQEDGVYDMNRELELPVVIQRVAVVSSRNAAGYQDFCKELANGLYRFEVELFDAFMQGAGADDSIIAALGAVADRSDDFDAVVVIRGGGSQSDLGCFDSYRLCCHLAQFPLPVIAGIGHDKDQSVADMVAAVSVKTPTAVAVYLKDRCAAFDDWLQERFEELSSQAVTLLDDERQRLQQAAVALKLELSERMHQQQLRLERLQGDLVRLTGQVVYRGLGNLQNLHTQLTQSVRYALQNCVRQLDTCRDLLVDRSRSVLQSHRQQLELLSDRIVTRDPKRMLELGFALVQSGGHHLTSVRDVRPGDEIRIVWYDGSADAEVRELHPSRKSSRIKQQNTKQQ